MVVFPRVLPIIQKPLLNPTNDLLTVLNLGDFLGIIDFCRSYLEPMPNRDGLRLKKVFLGNQWAYSQGTWIEVLGANMVKVDLTPRLDYRGSLEFVQPDVDFYSLSCGGFFMGKYLNKQLTLDVQI